MRTYESVAKEIKENPQKHQHANLGELQNCCILDGAIDLRLLDLHQQISFRSNSSGAACDVGQGPCSCGAWH